VAEMWIGRYAWLTDCFHTLYARALDKWSASFYNRADN
jgi:hypothetical protein